MSRRYITWGVVLCVVIGCWFGFNSLKKSQFTTIHVAIAGNLDNPTILNSANLYLKEHQKELKNSRIILTAYDDKKNKSVAKTNADVISESDAVAVIGHGWSSSSIAAGEIYKQKQIVAISPTSTHVNVTANNPWFFRTVFNDQFQGEFMSNYAQKVLNKTTAIIIHEELCMGHTWQRLSKNQHQALG